MSQITPSVGFSLFVLQDMTGRNIVAAAKIVLPFFILMTQVVVLIAVFPGLALWLPESMSSH